MLIAGAGAATMIPLLSSINTECSGIVKTFQVLPAFRFDSPRPGWPAMCPATPVGHILSRVLADPNTIEGRDAPWQHRSCGAVRPPLPQCEDLEEFERCAS